MKKHIATLFAAGSLAISAHAQSFQKMYGVAGGVNQQHLYGCLVETDGAAYASGTFRNISIFPEVTFRGTVSRLDSAGDLLWYKAYMPAGFDAMEGYFITSVIGDGAGALYTFGYYLGVTDEASGYYLQKIGTDGSVAWAKQIHATQPDLFAKAIFAGGAIYAAMGDRIARIGPNGDLLGSAAVEGMIVRDISAGADGDLFLTGEIYVDGLLHLPFISFSADLSQHAGFAYAAIDNTVLYADRLAEIPSGGCALLCSDGKVLRVAADGSVEAATRILPVETSSSLFSIIAYSGIAPLDGNTFAVQAKGFYADDQNFRHSIVTYEMDANGIPASGFRNVAQTPFGEYGQVTSEAFAAGADGDAWLAFGKVWNSDGSNALNYVQHGRLSAAGCGEEETALFFEELPPAAFSAEQLSDTLFVSAQLTLTERAMVVLDIPLDTDEKYCDNTLGIDGPQPGVITVFPNPAGDRLQVAVTGNVRGPIFIRDVAGRSVLSTSWTNTALDVSSLPAGMYIVEMNVDGERMTQRFLKE